MVVHLFDVLYLDSGLREEDHEQSVAFAAMWSILLAIAVSIAGTIIMRKVLPSLFSPLCY